MGTIVRITGWRPGLQKVSMAQVIRRSCELGLRHAKSCTDQVVAGKCVEVEVRDARTAGALARELQALGAVAEVVDDPA